MHENTDELNPLYRAAGDKYGTEYDITQLHQSGHGRVVHRDYLAHCLRWGWVAREVRFGDFILDAGCGQDVSMYDVLAGTKTFATNPDYDTKDRPEYVGVDLNKIKKKCGAAWATIVGELNFAEDRECREKLPFWGQFDVVVSLEVIEHMMPANGDKYLEACRDALAPGGHMYLSTPVFNGKAAKNHIHEYGIQELHDKIVRAGFEVVDRWGTFMSWNDFNRVATDEQKVDAARIRDYVGGEVIACMYASLYPNEARNNAWKCRKV